MKGSAQPIFEHIRRLVGVRFLNQLPGLAQNFVRFIKHTWYRKNGKRIAVHSVRRFLLVATKVILSCGTCHASGCGVSRLPDRMCAPALHPDAWNVAAPAFFTAAIEPLLGKPPNTLGHASEYLV